MPKASLQPDALRSPHLLATHTVVLHRDISLAGTL